jgi:hypothetical protein
MIMTSQMLQRQLIVKPDPPDDLLKAQTAEMRKFFLKHGYAETQVSDIIITHAAKVFLSLPRESQFDPDVPSQYGGPKKSLALMGYPGTGKTTALNILSLLFKWHITPIYTMAGKYASVGDKWLDETMTEWGRKTIILDDLGAETEIKHYGVSLPVQDIIAQRYDLWKYHGVMTYLSGNLTEAERLAKYGSRTADRIIEMCEIVPCCWPSFRKGGAK